MNNLQWSILVNLLFYSFTWDQAKAYVLANYVAAADQSAVGALMEANKTSGANLVAAGAVAPGSRTDSWYLLNSPFATGAPVIAPSAAIGDVHTIGADGFPTWAAPAAGGSGVDTLGAIGAVPNANAGTITGTTLVLQPANASFGGVMTTGTQTIAGAKTFSGALAASAGASIAGSPLGVASGVSLGVLSSSIGLWFSQAVPSASNYAMIELPTFGLFINSLANEAINFRHGNTNIAAFTPNFAGTGRSAIDLSVVPAGIAMGFTDSTGTPGNATINKPAGKSAIAAAAATCVITSNFVVAGDIIMITLLDLDTTAIQLKAVAGAGSFTVTANAAATATTKFSWFVIKTA